MRTEFIGRARSGGLLAVLALSYALALQAMLAPQAALAALAQDAAPAGHALCDGAGAPHAPDGDGQNACCLPGCVASCAPRQAAKEPPPAIVPRAPAESASLRPYVVPSPQVPAGTGVPSVAALPPQAHPRAPPARG